MAINKNAYARYKILDQCFSNQFKEYYILDLIEVCSIELSEHFGKPMSVSRRQIFDDMTFMKSDLGFSAPIESYAKGKKRYYRYEDPDFSIKKQELTQSERDQITDTLMVLSRVKGLGNTAWIEELKLKFDSKHEALLNNDTFISFQENIDLVGINYLGELYNYIKNKQALKITYKAFKQTESIEVIVSPQYLKQYNNRWFLFVWNQNRQQVTNFALDRIQDISIASETYYRCDIDFNKDYFEEIIGVTNFIDKRAEEVKIELSDQIIPYITTKPFHQSQKKIKDNILTIKVKINYELKQQILFYGTAMRVLTPESLANDIKQMLEESLNRYK
ncbi:WYL domain-containing protein [Myroides marinus]|uniref:helix-turn-helix transcriptional regulator n=1 Tax=Myroides marinus TaxID=703342 RepID=UPI002577476F|nr:WYL domain-containing protein [Myroides marinus]MDM1350936.1 WYL domain-containing protein [Myroides marinus]MDM1358143.1 WYL domain-containing protein [Myroides marinus]